MARHSIIEQLPGETRRQIEAFLRGRDGPITVDQFVLFLSEDLGLDIARSTAHRHLQKWQRAARRVRRVRDFASAMSLDLEEGQEGKMLRVLAETVADMAFDMVEAIQEGEALDAKALANLGKMVKDLAQGLHHAAARDMKIREQDEAGERERRYAVAQELLQELAAFVRSTLPQHLPALSEILEPFAAELAKKHG